MMPKGRRRPKQHRFSHAGAQATIRHSPEEIAGRTDGAGLKGGAVPGPAPQAGSLPKPQERLPASQGERQQRSGRR
jgi:hypothetical protein